MNPEPVARRSQRPRSLLELAWRISEPAFDDVRALYRVRSCAATRMTFDEAGWADATKVFGLGRNEIEQQTMVFVQSLHLMNEAVLNPLRGRRTGTRHPPDAAGLVDRELREKGCRWCDENGWHVSRESRLQDDFGTVVSEDGRFRGSANWARLAPVSGLVYGDEDAHNLFRLTELDFCALFETAASYIAKARAQQPATRYFVCFLNGGAKSAGSVAHAHVQVVGRDDRHFGLAEQVARYCPQDYWNRLATLHHRLGLARKNGPSMAWANLCPVKDRDITILSPDLATGASVVYNLLQSLIYRGTSSFSLTAILKPDVESEVDAQFGDWPGVVWRLVDRGDMRAAHADIGSLELLGGTAAVATDPWDVAAWIS
jgi:diadenosine tetraphosphate (Ap4A) HIT family hydrolase